MGYRARERRGLPGGPEKPTHTPGRGDKECGRLTLNAPAPRDRDAGNFRDNRFFKNFVLTCLLREVSAPG